MAHCLHECMFFNPIPSGALYPPNEWRGFTARWINVLLISLCQEKFSLRNTLIVAEPPLQGLPAQNTEIFDD